MSVKQVVMAAAGALGGESYWVSTLQNVSYGGGVYVRIPASIVDSGGNVYLVGTAYISSTYQAVVAKYDKSGSLLWQKSFYRPSYSFNVRGANIDDSGNIYLVGYDNQSTAGGTIVKIDSSGSISWANKLAVAGQTSFYAVVVDGSGDVIVVGSDPSNFTGSDIAVVKYNSSGTLQWQYRFNFSAYMEYAYGVDVDSSGNIYISGKVEDASSSQGGGLIKLNSSGSLQWQRTFFNNANPISYYYDVAVAPSGNIYCCGHVYDTSTSKQQFFVTKYNSSGTLQWQKILRSSSYTTYANSIALDSQENVYVGGYSFVTNNNLAIFAKYNSSGTLQWQRYFDASSSGEDWGASMFVDSNDTLYVSVFRGQSTSGSLVIKMPNDGSLTGTYGSYTYGALSYTDASGSETSTSGSTLSRGSLGGTASSWSATSGTTTFTSTTITL